MSLARARPGLACPDLARPGPAPPPSFLSFPFSFFSSFTFFFPLAQRSLAQGGPSSSSHFPFLPKISAHKAQPPQNIRSPLLLLHLLAPVRCRSGSAPLLPWPIGALPLSLRLMLERRFPAAG